MIFVHLKLRFSLPFFLFLYCSRVKLIYEPLQELILQSSWWGIILLFLGVTNILSPQTSILLPQYYSKSKSTSVQILSWHMTLVLIVLIPICLHWYALMIRYSLPVYIYIYIDFILTAPSSKYWSCSTMPPLREHHLSTPLIPP